MSLPLPASVLAWAGPIGLLLVLSASLRPLAAGEETECGPDAPLPPGRGIACETRGTDVLVPAAPIELPAGKAGADIRIWELHELRQGCDPPYSVWAPAVDACVRTTVPLPPELEWFAPLNRPLVRPPTGVIVLYPDGTWTEETACPPELAEEQHVNQWRFCRDPQGFVRVPRLWNPPVNGIPFAEVEAIFEANYRDLLAIDGVTSVGLGTRDIGVHTSKPALVPKAIDGVPVKFLPPIIGTPLSHRETEPVRPLTSAARIGSPMAALGQFQIGTLTAVALAEGQPWLILPAHLLRRPHETPVCPVGSGRRLARCPKRPAIGAKGTRTVDQPFSVTTVGKVTRWDIIPHRARTPPTLDVAAAFADTDTKATNGFLEVRGTIDGYGAWSGREREPRDGEGVTIVSSLSTASGGHVIQATVERMEPSFPIGCNPAESPCAGTTPDALFYTLQRVMLLEISKGSRCLAHTDSGSPVLGSDKTILGMIAAHYQWRGKCHGVAVSAPAIRATLEFDAWLGTETASGLQGHEDHCRAHGPCGAGIGDCDSDRECQAGLVCVAGGGARYGFGAAVDVCEAAPADDHGATPATATPISLPSTTAGVLTAGDVDAFAVTLAEAGQLTVFTEGSTDTYGTLRAAGSQRHTPLPLSDDDSGADTNFRLRATLPAGSYVVAGRGYSSQTTGPYTLHTSFVASRPPAGDWDYCVDYGPCEAGEGDCDEDSECGVGLACVANVGASYGFGGQVDVCEAAPSLPVGDWDYCVDQGPCGAGEGDCDSDRECASGLQCVANVGASYGFGATVDVCEAPAAVELRGNADTIARLHGHPLSLFGWALDALNPAAAGAVEIYVGGPVGTGTKVATVMANQPRPDVNAALGVPGDHGFQWALSRPYQRGSHTFYAYAVDRVSAPTVRTALGSTPLVGPPGGWSFCQDHGPCRVGQGDCDGSSECGAGLSCMDNVGASYGFLSTVDVCLLPDGRSLPIPPAGPGPSEQE